MFRRGFCIFLFFFKQKTAYEMRISDWSSDVCSSDLTASSAAQSRGHGLSGFAGEGAKLAASAAPMRPDSAGGAFARLVHMRAEGGDEGAQSRLDGGVDDQSFAIDHLAGARSEERRIGKECVRTGKPRGVA